MRFHACKLKALTEKESSIGKKGKTSVRFETKNQRETLPMMEEKAKKANSWEGKSGY